MVVVELTPAIIDILLSSSSAGEIKLPVLWSVSRAKFEKWTDGNYDIVHISPGNDPRTIPVFDDLIPGQTYFRQPLEANFDGYAKIEESVQTRDVMQHLCANKVKGLHYSANAQCFYEYAIHPREGLFDEKALGFRFPIKLDGFIIDGDTWTLIESKHEATNSDYNRFQNQVDFIITHCAEPWVLKSNAIKPVNFVPIAASIGPFKRIPSATVHAHPVKVTIRSGLGYELQ